MYGMKWNNSECFMQKGHVFFGCENKANLSGEQIFYVCRIITTFVEYLFLIGRTSSYWFVAIQ
jgi:hypothetical protein